MFDPFNDFDKNGYLQNFLKEKDELVIKRFEHNIFKSNIAEALQFLASKKTILYKDFLQVHKILFSTYYPWAGQDRSITMPDRAVVKGNVLFCHPLDSKRAIETALSIGQNKLEMGKRPGEVMGLFAYGHPFLDGNGRTMLLVHLELVNRAGFSIAWANTTKFDYLTALSKEIESSGNGYLDSYLFKFKSSRTKRSDWVGNILNMNGLDGLDDKNQIYGSLLDPKVIDKYRDFEKRRNYSYKLLPVALKRIETEVCNGCKNVPCSCESEDQSEIIRQRG